MLRDRLTKQEFIAQFPYKADLSSCDVRPVLDSVYEGIKVYRLLNLLIIKIGDEYYGHA